MPSVWIERRKNERRRIPLPRPVRPRRTRESPSLRRLVPNDARGRIAKACAAAAIPLWSPHDLRHRRISLLHLRGMPWARIGEFVGQRNLAVTANTYTHVLADETELDYVALLAS
jgi:integrase